MKYPLFLSDFNENLIFFSDLRGKKAEISSFIKIRPVEPGLFHADRRTDTTMLIVAFRNFANAPKNEILFKMRQCSNLNIVCAVRRVCNNNINQLRSLVFLYGASTRFGG